MKSLLLKRILHGTGSILSVVGVVFVAIKLSAYGEQIDFPGFSYWNLAALFGLVVIYATANVLLALAWKTLLQHLGMSVNFAWTIRTCGISQIAKYVPGNIFHLAGRQAIGQAAGLPAWPLAKSAAWELGLISVTGTIFGVLALPHFVAALSISLTVVVFVCVLCIVAVVLKKFVGPLIARAMAWYAAFFAVSGLIFTGLLTGLIAKGPIPPLQAISLCGAFVAAWLAGLVTPGAPAGVGVRELVLLGLLRSSVPEANLLLAVLLSRLVTVSGDFLFYLVALTVPGKPAPAKSCE